MKTHTSLVTVLCGSVIVLTGLILYVNIIYRQHYYHKDFDLNTPYKYGYIDTKGKFLIQPNLETLPSPEGAPTFHNGMVKFVKDGKYGFMDKFGENVIKPVYDQVYDFSKEYAWVQLGGKWGKIDKFGVFVVQPLFDEIQYVDSAFLGICIKNKWGFADSNGSILIEPQYNKISAFSDGLALVYIGETPEKANIASTNMGKWYCIDTSGNIVYATITNDPDYFEYSFSEGLAPAFIYEEDGTTFGKAMHGYVDHKGNTVYMPSVIK